METMVMETMDRVLVVFEGGGSVSVESGGNRGQRVTVVGFGPHGLCLGRATIRFVGSPVTREIYPDDAEVEVEE